MEIDKYGFTGGEQYTSPGLDGEIPVDKLRKREAKWLVMLDNWNAWMSKHFPQVKKRCRKGIPSSLRGRAWQQLCGSRSLEAQHTKSYEDLVSTEIEETALEDIEKDLHRQFPFHEMFCKRGGSGQQDLRDVLHAYVAYNPTDGYCQGQAPIAAVLLMHMPAKDAFWCMTAIFEHYISGYYSQGLEVIQVDGMIMQSLLRKVCPDAHKHLERLRVSPMLYCTEWFMCIFARTLPWPSVLRLWDMFFCEGVKVLFRCGLVLLRTSLEGITKHGIPPDTYETMEQVKKLNKSDLKPNYLMTEVINLKISETDLENEHKRQVKLSGKNGSSALNLVKRVYRYTPTSQHHGVVHKTYSTKHLSSVSVDTPQVIAQTKDIIENEQQHRDSVTLKVYRSISEAGSKMNFKTDNKHFEESKEEDLKFDGETENVKITYL